MEIRLAQLYYPACAEDVPCVLCGRELAKCGHVRFGVGFLDAIYGVLADAGEL